MSPIMFFIQPPPLPYDLTSKQQLQEKSENDEYCVRQVKLQWEKETESERTNKIRQKEAAVRR